MQNMLRALIVISAISGAALLSAVPGVAHAEEFSKAVGVPLKDAQAAMAKKQWDTALAKIKQADAVPSKKPFEEYAINEMLGYVLAQKRDYAGSARAYEENLAAGRTPADQVPARQRLIAQAYMSAKNYAKAADYGSRYLKSSPGDADMQWLVAQAQYHGAKDCKSAMRGTQSAIDAMRRQGKTPSAEMFKLKLTCQDATDDTEGMIETYEQLVRYYPDRENWKALLTTLKNQDMEDPSKLNLYRLMLELDLLNDPNAYVELAELAVDSGAPGEAVAVMEKGFANKVLENGSKERHQRLLNSFKTQAESTQAALAKLDEKARAAAKGDADLQLARAYMSVGQYQRAVEAAERGLKKGFAHLGAKDDAQILLGRAYLKLKQKEQAQKAFRAVPEHSKLAQVAQLWSVYAAQS